MSENVCYTDAYARRIEAVVVETDPETHAVLLDRTVFYPGGGGQPSDTGQLVGGSGGAWRVIGAKKRGEDIWHTIDEAAERASGRRLRSPSRSIGTGATS